MIPPKPDVRPGRVSLWRYWKLFRKDILSAQPERLYRAKMAEFRTPFFRSFLVNQPDLVDLVLNERPEDFPKSDRVTRGLMPLLGRSVFVTNGEEWKRQRRIIDPAFEGGQVKALFPAMLVAAETASDAIPEGEFDVERMASRVTADIIFRALFSIPIDVETAQATYRAFQAFQKEQPVATASALLPFLPVWHRRGAREAARELRYLIGELVEKRRLEIENGTAPDDLATRLMTGTDPESGDRFSTEEMVDQVAIFFLAGHETSAALLGWSLWLLAAFPDWGERVAEEGQAFTEARDFSALSKMPVTRNVLRETMRLYPPIPMFVRGAAKDEEFRGRTVRVGAQIVVSPWHLHRHETHWEKPDEFDPSRWEQEKNASARYLPFSTGPRVCPGAGFAMAEGAVLLSVLMARHRFDVTSTPVPVAHLTVRSRDGIRLKARPR